MKRGIALAAILLLGMVTAGAGVSVALTTITMDELPFQPVNGLTLKGVTFHDTTGAFFHASDGGQQHFTQDPTTTGLAPGEVLTVDFAQPWPFVQFGMSLDTQGTLTPAFSVELFDPSLVSLGVTNVDASPLPGDHYSEALFTHSGRRISRLVVTFPAIPTFPAFGFDNLTFGVPEVVPAMSPFGLLAMIVLLVAVGRARLY